MKCREHIPSEIPCPEDALSVTDFGAIADDEKDSVLLKFEVTKLKNYQDGDKVGVVRVFLKDRELYSTDLYIHIVDESKPGILQRIIDWFKNIW